MRYKYSWRAMIMIVARGPCIGDKEKVGLGSGRER